MSMFKQRTVYKYYTKDAVVLYEGEWNVDRKWWAAVKKFLRVPL